MGSSSKQHQGGQPRLGLYAGGSEVVARLHVADRMLARMRGLLGRDGLEPDEGLWITPCSSIHMFFMQFAIDVVFVDRGFRVVRAHERVQPWRMARGGRGAHSVFELPAGTIERTGLAVGDELEVRAADARHL